MGVACSQGKRNLQGERDCRNSFARNEPAGENGSQRSQNRPLRQYKEERRSAKVEIFTYVAISFLLKTLKFGVFGIFFFLRSGRVHGAAVSGIDTDRGIVSVEWFEKGETKGKEVS